MRKSFIVSIIILASGCTQNIETQAKQAASDFCNCIQENIFKFNKATELYAYCNTILDRKYRLMHVYYTRMDDYEYSQSLSQKTMDSVQQFVRYFLKHSDSCHSLPDYEENPF